MGKKRKFQDKPEQPKTLLEILHKDTSINVRVLAEQLKVVDKLAGALPILLMKERKVVEQTLTGYLDMSKKLLGAVHKNLTVQEAQIQKAVNLWKKKQVEEEEAEWKRTHEDAPQKPQEPPKQP